MTFTPTSSYTIDVFWCVLMCIDAYCRFCSPNFDKKHSHSILCSPHTADVPKQKWLFWSKLHWGFNRIKCSQEQAKKKKQKCHRPPMPVKVASGSIDEMVVLTNSAMPTTFFKPLKWLRSDFLMSQTYRAACLGWLCALTMHANFLPSDMMIVFEAWLEAQCAIALASFG